MTYKYEKTSLSERLEMWRSDRPDEWTMDEFIRLANKLQDDLAVSRTALRMFVNGSMKQDLRGGDLVITTCESLEAAEDIITKLDNL
jgi:hypothetical protein